MDCLKAASKSFMSCLVSNAGGGAEAAKGDLQPVITLTFSTITQTASAFLTAPINTSEATNSGRKAIISNFFIVILSELNTPRPENAPPPYYLIRVKFSFLSKNMTKIRFFMRRGEISSTPFERRFLRHSSIEEQRSQPAVCSKTLPPSPRLQPSLKLWPTGWRTSWAAGLLSVGCVGSVVIARSGDTPPSPPCPQPKSLAAAPLAIFRQALKQPFQLRHIPNAFHDMANRARILISQRMRRNKSASNSAQSMKTNAVAGPGLMQSNAPSLHQQLL